MRGKRDIKAKGWTVWAATWLAILTASLLSAISLAALSSRAAHGALEQALEDHLSHQAQLIAGILSDAPIELSLSLGGRTLKQLQSNLDGYGRAASLNEIAILGREKSIFSTSTTHTWLPERAEADLIHRARQGETVPGPLYRSADGAPYLTTYVPILNAQKQPTPWVLAIEGSAASLGAIDALENLQLQAIFVIIALTSLIAALLARLVVLPLQRLSQQLSLVKPGDPPNLVTLSGAQEVRALAHNARGLLSAISLRDQTIKQAHDRELKQLTRMAAEVAHEIRNPLNAIALSIERLPKLEQRDRRLKLMMRVRDQIADMEHIVHRLVNVAKPLTPSLKRTNIRGLLRALREEIGEYKVQMHITGPEDLWALSDGILLTEVLRNLCLNSAQAGAKSISVDLEVHGSTCQMFVSDDGSGIDPTTVDNLFAWFHTTKAQGSGLGLPTSRRMMQALGGQLELHSSKPTCFRMILPLEIK